VKYSVAMMVVVRNTKPKSTMLASKKFGGGRAIQVDSVNIGRHVGSVNMPLQKFFGRRHCGVAAKYTATQ
jgi:hypothetical protein